MKFMIVQRMILLVLFTGLLWVDDVAAADVKSPKEGSKAEPKASDTAKTGNLPPSTGTLADKAARAFSKHDWDTARKAYREMLGVDPENPLAWANLGAVEQQAGNRAAAVDCFEASTRFNGKLVQSWIALGLLYSEAGDRYKAISAFTRALHEDPLDARAHNYLAIEAQGIGWNETALSELQRAIELNPDYGIAHFNLAAMYLDRKPPAKELAKRHYDKALALGIEKDDVIESKLKSE
jgi:tetratricopeptide (TPR) repeat protein